MRVTFVKVLSVLSVAVPMALVVRDLEYRWTLFAGPLFMIGVIAFEAGENILLKRSIVLSTF